MMKGNTPLTIATAKFNILSKVGETYRKLYPQDELGPKISKTLTFAHLLGGMQNGWNFYRMMFPNGKICDSVVRERTFEMLAKASHLSYDRIYNVWMGK